MSEAKRNRFVYGKLIDLGFDPADPEILLEVGMIDPVDWDALDEDGIKCRKLSFVLHVAHADIGIDCRYDRVYHDHGEHGCLHVYVLALRPARNQDGRESQRFALETAVRESQKMRGRRWCTDIDRVSISWRHDPKKGIDLDNEAFVPEESEAEKPEATEDEVLRLSAAFDAFCDGIDPPPRQILADFEHELEAEWDRLASA